MSRDSSNRFADASEVPFPTMFYSPNYCCNCGEKIERVERSWSDSSRFCDVCKHDFVVPRLIPAVFAGLMAVVGLFGAGSLWRNAPPPKPPVKSATANRTGPVATVAAPPQNSVNAPGKKVAPVQEKRPETPVAAVDEQIFYCGAATKKGTACTRRVKGGGRCWQHAGQNSGPIEEKTPPIR